MDATTPRSWEVYAIRDGSVVLTWDWDDTHHEGDDWVRCKVTASRAVPFWREGQYVFIKKATLQSSQYIYCSLKSLGLEPAPKEVAKEPTVGWNFYVSTTDGHEWFLQKMEHHATKKITWCVIREYGSAWNFDTWSQVLDCVGAYATIKARNA